MALANFFEKAAFASAHVLNDFSLSGFAEHLEKQVVGLFFDSNAASSFEGRITCELTINLIARLYPRVALETHNPEGSEKKYELENIARSIHPKIEIADIIEHSTAVLVIGNKAPKTSAPCFFMGSNGWLAHFSPEKPMGSQNSNNPFGAAAAACIGTANVFRSVFSNQLGKPCDNELTLSLLNYGKNDAAETAELPLELDLKSIHLAGAGAIGNACLWVLSRGIGWHGNLSVIDPETIELSNLQRYVLTTHDSIEKAKTDIAIDYFNNSNINILPFKHSWQSFLKETGSYATECVAVALDSAKDRIAVQASLPKRIINSWTQPSDLGISRHNFGDGNACMACLYIPEEQVPSDSEKVATALGLQPDDMQVRELLYTGKPVDQQFADRVRSANPSVGEELDKFVGKPLLNFYSDAVCGSMLISHTDSEGRRGNVETPMAFQSAMAGVMLAAELVIEAGSLRNTPLPSITTVDLLDSMGEELSHPRKPHPSRGCICQDADFIAAYANKYDVTSREVMVTE